MLSWKTILEHAHLEILLTKKLNYSIFMSYEFESDKNIHKSGVEEGFQAWDTLWLRTLVDDFRLLRNLLRIFMDLGIFADFREAINFLWNFANNGIFHEISRIAEFSTFPREPWIILRFLADPGICRGFSFTAEFFTDFHEAWIFCGFSRTAKFSVEFC